MGSRDALTAPTFTAAQARAAGVSPRSLYRARDRGDVVEISRGVYRHADAPAATYPDLLAVAARAPRAVVCSISAAIVWDLTDEPPDAVHIAVPAGTHPPRIEYPPTRVYRLTAAVHGLGVTTVEAAPPGEHVPVYDAARTVVDLLRWRHRIGSDVAYAALHRYLDQPGASAAAVYEYAKALRVAGPALHALDVATAR